MSSRVSSPDRWVLIQCGNCNKVLAGWSGGYLDGDSWRLSSGIESVEEDGDYFNIKNMSGSLYRCHKDSEGFNIIMTDIYDQVEKACKDQEKEFKRLTIEDIS